MPHAVEEWRLECRTAGKILQLGFVVFHLHFIDIDQQLSKGSDEWFWLQASLEVADSDMGVVGGVWESSLWSLDMDQVRLPR